MPKKTKKQKLAAVAHRRGFAPIVHSIQSSPLPSPSVHTPTAFTYTPIHHNASAHIRQEHAIKKDILKTVALVIIILGIELLLSRYLS